MKPQQPTTVQSPQYLPVGLKDAIKLDITYKAIDLTNAAAELRTRMFSRKDDSKEYESFYLVFASLFYISFPYIQRYILSQKKSDVVSIAEQKIIELYRIFYQKKPPKSKTAMLILSRYYLDILRMSNLTEIGGEIQPFDEKLFIDRR